MSIAFSCIALVLAFLGLFEWDVPLTRFVRSLNDIQRDHLANPWLAQLSDVGDRLGRGESFVIISVPILAVGFGLKYESWKAAGWRRLLGHGVAAGVTKWQVVVPPALAYGERGAGADIGPNATLVFEIELVGIQ